jgi:hypothetical protein
MNLSFQDICWVEAIAQRTIVNYSQRIVAMKYKAAYAQALREVTAFYLDQRDTWGWIEREAEPQLRAKRLEYEKETDRLRRINAELDEIRRVRDEWYDTRYEQRVAVRKYNAQQRKRLGVRDAEVEVFQCMFDMAGGRGRWAYQEWLKGRSYASIGKNLNCSMERVRQIVQREIRRGNRPRKSYSPPKGRPMDMGGPRNVWLTYYPSLDPRLDNMEPVQLYIQDDPADILVERERQ